MKKILLALSVLGSLAIACNTVASAPMGMCAESHSGCTHANQNHPMMNPACKPLMEHMMQSRPQVEAAIKANNANKVGKLIIADHKFMEEFAAKNPECKPEGPMMMGDKPGKIKASNAQ